MEKFTVVVTEPIHEAGVQLLEREGVEVVFLPSGSNESSLQELAPSADALITRGSIKVTREIMTTSPRLKAIGVHGMGCDHVDLEAAEELGRVVFNTPTALTETVAEMTIGMMLALTRRLVSADKAVRAGEWNRKYGDLRGTELMGKTVGIIGLGRIGAAVARRLKPFEVKLIYHDVIRNLELEEELGMEKVELDTLLREANIVTLHVPYTPETHHLISGQEIELMRDGVYIVNMARGRVIDQDSLIETLRGGKVAGAAFDVFEVEPLNAESSLSSMDNVILTPHLGASSMEALRRMAVQSAEGVLRVLRGEAPDHPVVI
ncbi:MAG: hydroxyacid dehydrogenase [Candidatus Bathyarchaeota archaeon]|nr:MAG: hydroxyacid dehydrogenase [Candidatus Bathyarchaeota archaeon]